MPDSTRIYEVVHTSPENKTVQDYIEDTNSPAHGYLNDPDSFLLVKNNNGLTNREVIEATYTSKKEKETYAGKTPKEMLLKIGTRLVVEQQKVDRAGLLTQGLEVVSNDVPAFKAQQLADLESREGYSISDINRPIKGKIEKGISKDMYPDMTVWIWCRSLANEANNYQGEIFNVTPFLQKTNTCTTKSSGGNWQISLPPLVCEKNDKGQWVIKKSDIKFYVTNKSSSLQGGGYVAEGSMFAASTDPNAPLRRNQFLFHNLLSTNDLVFIRFETLQLEEKQRLLDEQGLYIDKNQLPNRIYDMIGLIDVNSISINPEANDVSIDIQGRDLSKLVIDDGTYFFYLEMSQGMLGGPGSAQNGGITQRLAADQALQYLSLYFNNSIENVFKFVINQLSSITIVPDDLFTAYGDRRNTKYKTESDQAKYNQTDQQIKTLTEQALASILNVRTTAGLNTGSPKAEKQADKAVFDEMKRFLQAIRDQKVRIVDGNQTVDWNQFKYKNTDNVSELIEDGVFPQYFVDNLFNNSLTRTVPESLPIIRAIDQIIDLETSRNNFNNQFQRQIAPGIWQIVKLVIDKAVTGRRLVDSSISSANGSLLNFFKKVCQEPFVEFYMDTYGDMYYFVIRKPPTDKAGMLSELAEQVVTENDQQTTKPAIIDIEAEDVISESLSFDDTEVVSWYHFTPKANFLGSSEAFSLAYLPAVYFPEYAEIWGSRPLDLSHNYLPMVPKDPKSEKQDIALKQAVEDMKYLIESNAYLPFTRKGTIKINGDRRHKAGNIIRYKPTGEIFRIEGVRQDFSINESRIERTTVLQVSRGMVEQLIYGVPGKDDNSGQIVADYISYFNIINTTPLYQYKKTTDVVTDTVKVTTKKTTYTRPANQPPSSLTSDISKSGDLFITEAILTPGNQNTYLLNKYSQIPKNVFTNFVNGINQRGYLVIITSGVRTVEEQKALYKQNSKNARPGHSKHEAGIAIDINIVNEKTKVKLTKSSSSADWLATGIPQYAKSIGLKWGGDSFRDYHDPVHFEIVTKSNYTNSVTETEETYVQKQREVTSTNLDVAKIFSNFKVNKSVFDFFLSKQQFDKQYLVPTTKQ